MKQDRPWEYSEIESTNFFRIDSICAEQLRVLLSQLIETHLDEDCHDTTILVSLTKSDLYYIARAYRDLCTGYRHPRVNSRSYHFRPNDRTLQRLYTLFPNLIQK